MKFTTLNNGVQMPLLGFGVYQMGHEGMSRSRTWCTSDGVSSY